MTEHDRQKKIARALVKISQLSLSLAEIGSEFSKATMQLERLAGEFEAGRYLSKETNATESSDPAPDPGESDAP